MAWIVGLLAVIGFGWLMYTNEKFRRFGFGIICLIALGIAGLWYMTDNQNRQFKAERARALAAIAPHQLTLRDLKLSQDDYGWRLKGSVLNNSSIPMRALVLRVYLSDCPTPSDEGCVVVGQDDARIYMEVPARQARQIDTSLRFENSPKTGAHWVWDYTVQEIEAKLD